MIDWMKQRRSLALAIALFVMCSAAATAAALSCTDGNAELVLYEVVSVSIDGVVTETMEFGTGLEVSGAYDGINVYPTQESGAFRRLDGAEVAP